MDNRIDIKTSFSAADSIPLKVVLDKELQMSIQRDNRLLPIHIQFLPTNKCNLKCKFCSCSERNKSLEIDFELAKALIGKFKATGTKAVTITGGGEPLMYPRFSELLQCFHDASIKIGLVTNGLLLHKSIKENLGVVTWCRISNDDSRNFTKNYQNHLKQVVTTLPSVDWAFSHVVSSKPNVDEIARIINFANCYDFTHVRLVADLFYPEYINMELLAEKLRSLGVDDSKVIYQGRKAFERGNDCYIGYLKPLIGPDAKVYACCGVQYALEVPSKDLPQELCLGDAMDIEEIMARSNLPLDGSICVKCYYNNYNNILRGMLKTLVHQEFV